MTHPSSASWSDDRIALLKTLWLQGESASAVARRLGGVTRNAVIGKVHRLGLSGRATPTAPVLRATRAAGPKFALVRSVKRSAPAPSVSPLPSPLPPADRVVVSLGRLGAGACRWPLGDPRAASFGFCGAVASRGSYCAEHASAAYRPPPQNNRAVKGRRARSG